VRQHVIAAAELVSPARVLVLFGADWDERLLPRYTRHGRYRFHEHGFDLFRIPSNARLMWFDLWRFVDRMVEPPKHPADLLQLF